MLDFDFSIESSLSGIGYATFMTLSKGYKSSFVLRYKLTSEPTSPVGSSFFNIY